MALALTGCVDQSAAPITEDVGSDEIVAPIETRIIATSNATMQITDALNLDLIARCETAGTLADRYVDLPTVGTAMSPDAEAILMLEPTDIIGPDTLIETIKPTYDAAGIEATWLDLQSVEGMYESIAMLGEKYDRVDEAQVLLDAYYAALADFAAEVEGLEPPRVMVLMGLPGAYIGCTDNSYVGSLVNLTGAENVIKVDDNLNFVSWNTEALIELDPDIILLTAHGLPDLAMEFFTKEFATNDIWKNFRAVEEGRVYALDYDKFGMSATFGWTDAFADLQEIFYGDTYESFIG